MFQNKIVEDLGEIVSNSNPLPMLFFGQTKQETFSKNWFKKSYQSIRIVKLKYMWSNEQIIIGQQLVLCAFHWWFYQNDLGVFFELRIWGFLSFQMVSKIDWTTEWFQNRSVENWQWGKVYFKWIQGFMCWICNCSPTYNSLLTTTKWCFRKKNRIVLEMAKCLIFEIFYQKPFGVRL